MKSFHNTIDAKGQTLMKFESRAIRQEDKILEFFKKHPDQYFTPFEVHKQVFDSSTPIQSIRRAMSNMTKSDLLEKTKDKRIGIYGVDNYLWKLNNK